MIEVIGVVLDDDIELEVEFLGQFKVIPISKNLFLNVHFPLKLLGNSTSMSKRKTPSSRLF